MFQRTAVRRKQLQCTLRREQILKTFVRANCSTCEPHDAVTLPDSCSGGDWITISYPCSLLIQINLSTKTNKQKKPKSLPINLERMF